jgi:Protein of unknown function (DUF1015)
VVEHRRFRGAGCPHVVMDGDAVEKLGLLGAGQPLGLLLDQPQAKVDVAEQAALVGGREGGAGPELERSPDVVEEGGGQQELGAKPRVELGRLATERRDADRVLEQAAGVGVVIVPGRRERREVAVGEHAAHGRTQAGVGDLLAEELEESLELGGVAAEGRRQRGGIDVGRLERAHVELQPVAELLHAPQHADGVPRAEAAVEQLDIVPDPGVDVARGVDELECEVRGAALRPQPPFRPHREDTLDDPVGNEIRDHLSSLDRAAPGSLGLVATITPFRALRYDERVAGPLTELVAPPYDVIDDVARADYLARNPHNVVHLTLPDSPEQAAADLREWRDRGVLREEAPALWWVAQDYTGPDGIARTREGIAGSIDVSPYAERKVLPHELTHAGPKEGRLALLRATHTQLEPIFLLYDADPPVDKPAGPADLDVEEGGVRTRLWRLDAGALELDVPLLIADGHHRYETAVAFRDEDPAAARTFAVLVSARTPGVEIFPTHRLVQRLGVEPHGEETPTWDHRALAAYRDGRFVRLESEDELDARAVERYEPEGVSYTASADQAIAAVDAGEAALAFLVRAPTIAQVAAFARRGETMPQKSTFFYPKLTSGLLLHPV